MLDLISLAPSPVAQTVLSLSVMLLAAFLVTRLTKRLRLPNVTGYIVAGVLIGPYVLGLIPSGVATGMDFVTDVALALIAFGVGKYFKFSIFRRNMSKVLIITVLEALTASLLVTLTMIFVFGLSVEFSLLLGAISAATAPASTIMTIRQYKAKGEFVNLILQVVAIDDAVALIAFSVCAAVVQGMDGGGGGNLWLPMLYNVAALGAGGLLGFVLHKLIDGNRSKDHRLALTLIMLLGLTGLCTLLDISPLLSCMALGTVYINAGGGKQIFKQVNAFAPPILMLFFVLSGMRLSLPSLVTAGLIGVVYFFVRILGKYAGAFAGAALCRCDPPIRKYLGLALIPQAGVSIGLAVLGQRILPEAEGLLLSTIILSSGLLYELIGPACAKLSLRLSGSLTRPDGQKGPEKDDKNGGPPALPASDDALSEPEYASKS